MTTPTASPATLEDRHPNEQGELEDAQVAPEMNSETLGINERSIDPLTRFATKLNTRPKPELPMFNFHSHHDFRDLDGKPDEKRDPGSWSDWANKQPKKIPGVG